MRDQFKPEPLPSDKDSSEDEDEEEVKEEERITKGVQFLGAQPNKTKADEWFLNKHL